MVGMDRLLIPYIKNDLSRKTVLLTGPRQPGKTTFVQMLVQDFDSFN